MSSTTFNVELRSIDTIRPYESNPRLNDAAVDAVAASLREFGFRQPIVVDPDGVIIVGHTRWKAARKLELARTNDKYAISQWSCQKYCCSFMPEKPVKPSADCSVGKFRRKRPAI